MEDRSQHRRSPAADLRGRRNAGCRETAAPRRAVGDRIRGGKSGFVCEDGRRKNVRKPQVILRRIRGGRGCGSGSGSTSPNTVCNTNLPFSDSYLSDVPRTNPECPSVVAVVSAVFGGVVSAVPAAVISGIFRGCCRLLRLDGN